MRPGTGMRIPPFREGKQSACPTLSVLAPPENRRIPGGSPNPLYGGANEAEERETDYAPGDTGAI